MPFEINKIKCLYSFIDPSQIYFSGFLFMSRELWMFLIMFMNLLACSW